MTVRYVVGDTRDVVSTIPDASVDLIITSPPFLALRSYLPADHPDKAKELGSEPNPAAFIDMLLALTAEWRRVLAPHGTLAVELGDTYSGSGGAGGDYAEDGLRAGQAKFDGAAARARKDTGWPLQKSATLIPELYRVALAYGINPLTGQESPAGRWRVRNTVTWCRPNPPVGALGDKFRPSTSDLVIACTSDKRWFDLDAVRTHDGPGGNATRRSATNRGAPGYHTADDTKLQVLDNPAGAPPLDHWIIPPGGYSGKVTSTRRVPCGPDDGGERTTSPDCPVHGGQLDPAPKARRGGRGGASSTRTGRSDDHPEPALPLAVGTSGSTLDHEGSSPVPTLEPSDPGCAPAAKPRSKASSRTAPAPATTSPGTASGRSPARTGDTSESPPCDEPRPGTPSSSTSEDGSDGPLPSPGPRTAGNETGASSSACSCSYWLAITESTSHYAVFPPALIEKPIEACCPRRVCRTCGTPSVRQVDVLLVDEEGNPTSQDLTYHEGTMNTKGNYRPGHVRNESTTTGWSSCDCPGTDGIRLDGYHTGTGWRPGLVLDPFGGSGTTGVVASGRSRDCVLVDLDERNADLARERLGMFLEVEHHNPEAAA